METLGLKRPPPVDEDVVEGRHAAKKVRFENFRNTAVNEVRDDEGRGDEDVMEQGYGEKEERPGSAVRTDLADLPAEVLLQIFRTGTSLQLAEQVSARWRAKIESTPVLWKNACARLSVNEETVTHGLRKRLDSDEPEFRNKALVWRGIWLKYSKKVCQHCFNHEGTEYPLFDGIILCPACRRLEPYNAVTLTAARIFFRIHDDQCRKKMKEKNIALDSYPTYQHMSCRDRTLYKFTQLVELAEIVHDEMDAQVMADMYRRHSSTKKMQGVHLREL